MPHVRKDVLWVFFWDFTWLLPVNKEIRSNISFIKHEFHWARDIWNNNRFLLLYTECFSKILCYLLLRKPKIPSLVILRLVLILQCNKMDFFSVSLQVQNWICWRNKLTGWKASQVRWRILHFAIRDFLDIQITLL